MSRPNEVMSSVSSTSNSIPNLSVSRTTISLFLIATISFVTIFFYQVNNITKSNVDKDRMYLIIDQSKFWMCVSSVLLIVLGSLWLFQDIHSKYALIIMTIGWILFLFMGVPFMPSTLTPASSDSVLPFFYDKARLISLIPGVFLTMIPLIICTIDMTHQNKMILCVLYFMAWVAFGVTLALNHKFISKDIISFTVPGSLFVASGMALIWSHKLKLVSTNADQSFNLLSGGMLVALGWVLLTSGVSLRLPK